MVPPWAWFLSLLSLFEGFSFPIEVESEQGSLQRWAGDEAALCFPSPVTRDTSGTAPTGQRLSNTFVRNAWVMQHQDMTEGWNISPGLEGSLSAWFTSVWIKHRCSYLWHFAIIWMGFVLHELSVKGMLWQVSAGWMRNHYLPVKHFSAEACQGPSCVHRSVCLTPEAYKGHTRKPEDPKCCKLFLRFTVHAGVWQQGCSDTWKLILNFRFLFRVGTTTDRFGLKRKHHRRYSEEILH